MRAMNKFFWVAALSALLLSGIAGCAGMPMVFDPICPPLVVHGPYIDWCAPSPASEYSRAYWEEKRQQAERRYQDALNRAREAGRNRAQEEELRRRGYWR